VMARLDPAHAAFIVLELAHADAGGAGDAAV
jgi:hypothetical protein